VTILPSHRTRSLHRTALTLERLAHLARRSRSQIVVSNQSKGHVYGGAVAAILRRPSVYWQQGIPDRSALELLAARVPSAAIVCSSADALAAQLRLTPKRLVRMIHLGVDLGAVASRQGTGAAVRQSLGWDRNPIVGVVGRLQPGKGQDTFLRAAGLIAGRHPEARFVVVGGAVLGWEGSYPDELEELAMRLGIAEQVHFAGHQSDVYPWFDACDIVAHTSFNESFGLVLVEAMALGKPLVAAAEGGPLEIVEDGVSGMLVPPGQPERLAAALGALLDEPEDAARIGRAARERAQLFSEERMAAEFARLLGGLVEARSPAGAAVAAGGHTS
jgi:glycosyltransferase involved in cell wall biosynthesis